MLEINSAEYWDLRHIRDTWYRHHGWLMPTLAPLIPSNATLLIVGCGQGAEASKLLELRPDIKSITGIDISPAAIKKAKVNCPDKRVEFICEDVFELRKGWTGRYFDYVISIQNFEHWEVKTHSEAFRNIWSRVVSGGKFFFTGVGRNWDLSNMNYGSLEYGGEVISMANDHHYCNWSEQDFYDLAMTQNPISVKFWRIRKKNRVVAEVEKP